MTAPSRAPEASEQEARGRRFGAYLRLGLGLALLGVLLAWVDVDALWGALVGVSIPVVLPAAMLSFALDFLSAVKLHLLARHRVSSLTLWQTTRLYFVSVFFGTFLPTSIGGDAVKMGALARHGGSLAAAGTAVVLERLSGVLGLWAVTFGLAVVLPETLAPYSLEWFARPFIFGSIAAVAGVALAGLLMKQPIARFLRGSGGGRIVGFARRVGLSLWAYADDPALIAFVLLLSVAFHALRGVCLLLFALGFAQLLPFASLLWGAGIVMVISFVPLSPGALGLREGAITGCLVALGMDPAEALAVALLSRATTTLKALTGGIMYAAGPVLPEPTPAGEGNSDEH
jgi:uncharacterized membrane protein YbhN (UPF0104 family)